MIMNDKYRDVYRLLKRYSITKELDDDTRKHISLDGKNQYLIIGRNPKNLFAPKENLFELVSKKVGEQTKLTMRAYI